MVDNNIVRNSNVYNGDVYHESRGLCKYIEEVYKCTMMYGVSKDIGGPPPTGEGKFDCRSAN